MAAPTPPAAPSDAGLTTHVLDTMNGCPAAGMAVALFRLDGDAAVPLKSLRLDADGRAGGPLLAGAEFAAGRYRLLFQVADYFRGRGVALPEPPFLAAVPVDFGIADAGAHYHVPLLVSPWSFATYRGS
jgi:5-hydroxyisourate hydrolase